MPFNQQLCIAASCIALPGKFALMQQLAIQGNTLKSWLLLQVL